VKRPVRCSDSPYASTIACSINSSSRRLLGGQPTCRPLTSAVLRRGLRRCRHCRRGVSPKPCGSSPVVSGDSSPKLGQSVKFFARANGAAAAGRVIGRDGSPLSRNNLTYQP
jgi:hypothetical protein